LKRTKGDSVVVEPSLVDLDLQKAHAVVERLKELGYRDEPIVGRLSADLSDLYAGATRVQRLLDDFLGVSTLDRDRFGETLSDLCEEMRHIAQHIESSLDDVEGLAERFDD